MYMRVTKGRVKPGCWDAYEAAYKKYIEGSPLPEGLLGRFLVRAVADPDVGFSLSLWSSLKAMEIYERSDSARREILPHIAAFLTNDYVAHHCDVTVVGPVSAGDPES